ncbi:MAG: hypothetical protein WCD37_15595 [Chloroflexia bacterium]
MSTTTTATITDLHIYMFGERGRIPGSARWAGQYFPTTQHLAPPRRELYKPIAG